MENSSLSSDVWQGVTTSSFLRTSPVASLHAQIIYPIIGTVGVLDNLFVIIVFAFFTKVADKVFIHPAIFGNFLDETVSIRYTKV